MAKRFVHKDRFINQELARISGTLDAAMTRLNRVARNLTVLDALLLGGSTGEVLAAAAPEGNRVAYAWTQLGQAKDFHWNVVAEQSA